jgi:hypothetical protein
MVTVIGMSTVMTLSIALIATQSVISVTGARQDRAREQAIQVADGATNATMERVTSGARATDIVLPADYASWSAACEKAWAIWAGGQPTSTSSPQAPCPTGGATWTPPTTALLTGVTANGRWASLYPALPSGAAAGIVYGVGAAPSVGALSTRVVRVDAQLLTTTSVPLTHAVYATGNLTHTGGGNVSGASGHVHINGDLSYTGSGQFTGNVTYGSCSAGCTGTPSNVQQASCKPVGALSGCVPTNSMLAPNYSLPVLTPRSFWPLATYAMCPDGKVHLAPGYSGPLGTAPSATSTPCDSSNPVIASSLNWSYSGGEWKYGSGSANVAGVYYFYGTHAKLSGGGQFTGSLIAEGLGTGCSLTGGSITDIGGGGFTPSTGPIAPIAMLADGPLKSSGGGPSYSGVFYTNQYFEFTGGATHTNVALVANDLHSPKCGDNKMNGGGSFSYDGTLSIPGGPPSALAAAWDEL